MGVYKGKIRTRKEQLNWIKDILIFVIIILGFHYLYLWALPFLNSLEIYRLVLLKVTNFVFFESSWIVKTFIYDITTSGRIIYLEGNRFIEVSTGCSGFKPTLEFFVLFILFPGSWEKKSWYIPLGIILIHLLNIIRIVSLTIIIMNCPQIWEFAHDWIFRPLFYIFIFGMWVIWNEKMRLKVIK